MPLARVEMSCHGGRLAKEVSCWLPALLPAGWTVALHTSATTGSVFRARLKPLARQNKTDKAGLDGGLLVFKQVQEKSATGGKTCAF